VAVDAHDAAAGPATRIPDPGVGASGPRPDAEPARPDSHDPAVGMTAMDGNRDIARTALERVCARGDMALARDCYAENFTDHVGGQSFVLVQALEALAVVFCAQRRPRSAAVLLGTAHTARQSASKHMRPISPPDDQLHRALVADLGAAAFETAHGEGVRLAPADALRFAPFDEPDTSRPVRLQRRPCASPRS